VSAFDGVNTTSQAVSITVTDVNEAPSFSSAASASFNENATGVVYTALASDPDKGASLTYSLSGADAARFAINSSNGQVTFNATPNFEAPLDVGGDNVYDIIVSASDGTNTATKAVSISVTNLNEAPLFVSGTTATLAENASAAAYTASVTDPENSAIAYSLGGADAALFTINSAGVVSFKSPPNFEAPGDADANNVYAITVSAFDGVNTTSQAVSITVTDVNEAPSFSSAASASFNENATGVVYTALASDPDKGASLTYSLSGADAARFAINSSNGQVTFNATPNFEAPLDVGGDNIYDIIVSASDGTNTATKAVSISVTNLNEAHTITSASTGSFNENGTGTAYQTQVSDPDLGAAFSYSLSGADANLFTIDSAGAVSFKTAPNREAPSDQGLDNVYDIVVSVSDGVHTATKTVAITVNDVNEAPTLTSATTVSVAENTGTSFYTASAIDPENTKLSYMITGTDASRFVIDAATGALRFSSAPNFESPNDAGLNNVYDVIIHASDGERISTQALAVTVTNVNEAPSFSSGSSGTNIVEGSAASTQVYDANATDPEGTAVTFSLSAIDDGDLFNINATTGVVTFKATPNFETPLDTGANNGYRFTVFATSDGQTTSRTVTFNVTNTLPTFSSGSEVVVTQGVTGAIHTASASDLAGGTVTYSLSGSDSARFTINASTGALSWLNSPSFATPWDIGLDNIYNFVIVASDGTGSTSQNFTVTVRNNSSGADSISGGSGNDILDGLAGADTLNGNAGDDTLRGGNDADTLNGGAGNDLLDGGNGGDALDGGSGTDTVTYATAPSGVTVTLGSAGSGSGSSGFANGDSLAGIERIIGSGFTDTFHVTPDQGWIIDGADALDVVRFANNSGNIDNSDLVGLFSQVEQIDFTGTNVKASVTVSAALVQSLDGDGNVSEVFFRVNSDDIIAIDPTTPPGTFVDSRDEDGIGEVVFYSSATIAPENIVARFTVAN
jgi:serralysin